MARNNGDAEKQEAYSISTCEQRNKANPDHELITSPHLKTSGSGSRSESNYGYEIRIRTGTVYTSEEFSFRNHGTGTGSNEKSPAVGYSIILEDSRLLRRFQKSSLIPPCGWRAARGDEVEEVGEGAAGSAVSSGHFPEKSWQYKKSITRNTRCSYQGILYRYR
jgi:hypothetical protein